MNTEIYIST